MISRFVVQSASLSSFCKWLEISVRRLLTNRKRACLDLTFVSRSRIDVCYATFGSVHSSHELLFLNHPLGEIVLPANAVETPSGEPGVEALDQQPIPPDLFEQPARLD